jgi:hypothetical protein
MRTERQGANNGGGRPTDDHVADALASALA